MNKIKITDYRKDIDGLRAIAVMAVILFHLGFLPNGYLGVDVFFAISGYLITKIAYNDVLGNQFSILGFYLRRIRRIIPLVLFTSLTALIIGLFVMLPDDFENLCQSVFATNVFANNILLLITSGNYWAIANEYKPLMHTWSLGIEEQFYLIFPLLFILLDKKRSRLILPVLFILALISLLLFVFSTNPADKFYSIQFRFFELSFGGIGYIICKDRLINARYKVLMTLFLLFILLFDFHLIAEIKLILVVLFSIGLLISDNKNKIGSLFLENKIMVGIGKISFSLYMWHQIVLAYMRYCFVDKPGVIESIYFFVIIFLLSIFSYFIIEQPFRDKNRINTKFLLQISGFVFLFTCIVSYYLYSIGGIVRNVPELEINKSEKKLNHGSGKRNIHIEYNAKIYDLDKKFTTNEKTKVLVIGNSFARDFANILLESQSGNQIEISYVYDINACADINDRLEKAKFIFFSELSIDGFHDLERKYNIDSEKVWNVGTKNFGSNNGIFYNKKRDEDYCFQRTFMTRYFLERNNTLKKQWGKKYIDLIGAIIDKDNRVPVFTSDCTFISQDCSHLTHAGAVYFSKILNISLSEKNGIYN